MARSFPTQFPYFSVYIGGTSKQCTKFAHSWFSLVFSSFFFFWRIEGVLSTLQNVYVGLCLEAHIHTDRQYSPRFISTFIVGITKLLSSSLFRSFFCSRSFAFFSAAFVRRFGLIYVDLICVRRGV